MIVSAYQNLPQAWTRMVGVARERNNRLLLLKTTYPFRPVPFPLLSFSSQRLQSFAGNPSSPFSLAVAQAASVDSAAVVVVVVGESAAAAATVGRMVVVMVASHVVRQHYCLLR